MGILLIDSSSKKIEFGYYINNEEFIIRTLADEDNADSLIYHINNFFRENKTRPSEIDTISISNGPGSFTGLRIASSIAKGICFASDSKFVELNSLDIIANKSSSEGEKVSLIFSNTKTLEFYFCRYKKNKENLSAISDYGSKKINEIITNENDEYLINEQISEIIPSQYRQKLTDVSGISGIISMLELTKQHISAKKFNDFRTSEPFYMREFIPNK